MAGPGCRQSALEPDHRPRGDAEGRQRLQRGEPRASWHSRRGTGWGVNLKHPPFWRGICRKKRESHLRQEREEKHHSLSCFIVQVTLLDLLRAGFASGGSEQRGPEGVRVRGILGRGRGVRPGRPARCTPPLRTRSAASTTAPLLCSLEEELQIALRNSMSVYMQKALAPSLNWS